MPKPKHVEAFLEYKMKVGGSVILSIGGVNVWLKPDGYLLIGDIDASENIDFRKFVSKLKKYAFFVGADVIMFQTVPNTKLDLLFCGILSPVKAFPFGYCLLNESVDPLQYNFVLADVDTF